MTEEIDKRIQVGIHGKPQIKQHELERFLGTYKERVYLTMTAEEMREEKYQAAYKTFILALDDPDATVHVHAEVEQDIRSLFTKMTTEVGLVLTFYSNSKEIVEGQFGLVICSKHDVLAEKTDIADLFPTQQVETTVEKKEPKGFFNKLFKK
ncbi:MAG: YueI family protein [Streptococcaceae bacterium]|nr:YueI family protein [Streptococcaceae bacterium]